MGVHLVVSRFDYKRSTLEELRRHVALPSRLDRAVLRRKVDFLAGRFCALEALAAQGYRGADAVAIGAHGQPLWPEGFVGSISHTDRLAAAAVATSSRAAAIGVDVELDFTPEIAAETGRQIASPEELDLGIEAGIDPERWLTMVFSAKESVFKALFPRILEHFDFLDLAVTNYDPRCSEITIALLPERLAASLRGETLRTYVGHIEGYVASLCLIRP